MEMRHHLKSCWKESWTIFWQETRALLRVDILSGAIVLGFLLLFLPSITRYTTDAPLLAAFIDDDPLITMQLDGMTAKSYGNPANYLDVTNPHRPAVPAHWHRIRYSNLPYYGGLLLDGAFAIWVPLKAIGLPLFPTAPIVLRLVTLLFTSCTFLAAYNLGRNILGPWAGFASCFFLLTAYHFIAIGTVIHPDSLLFFLDFLALALSIRHAQKGDMESLAALAIAAGLAQGAKMGGPLLVPLTGISLLLGCRQYLGANASLKTWIKTLVLRGAVAGLVALLVFMMTTPYAFFDSYYIHTWCTWGRQFTSISPHQATGFRDWIKGFFDTIGPVIAYAGVVGLLARLAIRRSDTNNLPFLFYLFFSATILLFYATLDTYWVQPQYLVVPMCFMAAMAGNIVDQSMRLLPPAHVHRVNRWAIIFCAIGLTVFSKPLLLSTVSVAVDYADWRSSERYLMGQWVEANLPHGARVMWDEPAYFPSDAFPDQRFNGGPLKYMDLAREMPDYFLLTEFNFPMWMTTKTAEAPLPRWDETYANMRLYQDLLGYDAFHPKLHPGAVPGATFLTSQGAHGMLPQPACDTDQSAAWREVKSWFGIVCHPSQSRTLFLFKLNHASFLATAPEKARALAKKAAP